jgi:hypothetical protein
MAATIAVAADDLAFVMAARAPIDLSLRLLLNALIQGVGSALAIFTLALSWRESRGQDRTRYALMLVAIGLLVVSQDVITPVMSGTGSDWSMENPLVVIQLVGSLAGAGVFAYAVLRHRVVDLGFAINRTLVYGALSGLLLVAFGLIEWAVEDFMPRGGREASVLVDAGVALAVFLTFHRVRDVAEHAIERLFFRSWQQAEAALRRFVRDPVFATRPRTLTEGFVAALGRYAEGAEAAIYLLGEDGGYERADWAAAEVGETLDADDPALIAMRAEPKAQVVEAALSKLDAALIAPMVNRNEVIGLAVLGAKPSATDYRPDEIELIGWATRQVGLDLHALKMERLEASEADLHNTVAMLRTEITALRSVLPQRT